MNTQLPQTEPSIYPILVLPETVLFPRVTMPVVLIEERELILFESVVAGLVPGSEERSRLVLSLSQWDSQYSERPQPNPISTLAEVTDWEQGGAYERRVELRGIERVEIGKVEQREPFIRARVERLGGRAWSRPTQGKSLDQAAQTLRQRAQDMAFQRDEQHARLLLNTLEWITDPGVLADYVAHHLVTDWYLKQEMLEMVDPAERIAALLDVLGSGRERVVR